MVKIDEHSKKMKEMKKHINKKEGNQKRQYIKGIHRLQKELWQCQLYLRNEMK